MAITANPIRFNSVVVGEGTQVVSNITAATVIKPVGGRIAKVSVIVAGSTVGAVHNCATTGAAAAANQVGAIAEAVGTYDIGMPCPAGIVVVPGTGQTLAVSFA